MFCECFRPKWTWPCLNLWGENSCNPWSRCHSLSWRLSKLRLLSGQLKFCESMSAVSGESGANQYPWSGSFDRTSWSHALTTSNNSGMSNRKVVACFPFFVLPLIWMLFHYPLLDVNRNNRQRDESPTRIPERYRNTAAACILCSAIVWTGTAAILLMSSKVTASRVLGMCVIRLTLSVLRKTG